MEVEILKMTQKVVELNKDNQLKQTQVQKLLTLKEEWEKVQEESKQQFWNLQEKFLQEI